MVKIKQKKTMNLPQLIEWAMENDIKVRVFESNPNFDGVTYRLGFDKGGDLYFEESLAPTLLFTVEVEEEITEDTVIDEMLTIYKNGVTHITNDKSLNYLDKTNLKSAYTMGDDLRLILIWRDGKLVE